MCLQRRLDGSAVGRVDHGEAVHQPAPFDVAGRDRGSDGALATERAVHLAAEDRRASERTPRRLADLVERLLRLVDGAARGREGGVTITGCPLRVSKCLRSLVAPRGRLLRAALQHIDLRGRRIEALADGGGRVAEELELRRVAGDLGIGARHAPPPRPGAPPRPRQRHLGVVQGVLSRLAFALGGVAARRRARP